MHSCIFHPLKHTKRGYQPDTVAELQAQRCLQKLRTSCMSNIQTYPSCRFFWYDQIPMKINPCPTCILMIKKANTTRRQKISQVTHKNSQKVAAPARQLCKASAMVTAAVPTARRNLPYCQDCRGIQYHTNIQSLPKWEDHHCLMHTHTQPTMQVTNFHRISWS